MKQKIVVIILAAIVVLGGIYLYINNNKAGAPSDANIQNTNSESEEEEYVGDVPGDAPDTSTQPTSDTVAVSTQVPGDYVTIDNAFLEKAGFITIHEVNAKGMAGNIIGTSGLLTTGPKQDLEIKATLKPGAKYMAMLHIDNGDKKFNELTDVTVTNNNIPVMTMFSVSQ